LLQNGLSKNKIRRRPLLCIAFRRAHTLAPQMPKSVVWKIGFKHDSRFDWSTPLTKRHRRGCSGLGLLDFGLMDFSLLSMALHTLSVPLFLVHAYGFDQVYAVEHRCVMCVGQVTIAWQPCALSFSHRSWL